MAEVIFALGANLGDPAAQLEAAVRMLGEVVEITALSSVYRTEPAGYHDQPDFLNAVVVANSPLSAAELLASVVTIERDLGRMRSFPNAPRMIDIDILALGTDTVDEPDLQIPHARLHQRAFVLVPLAEAAPYWRHPASDRTAAQMLALLQTSSRVERWGELRVTR